MSLKQQTFDFIGGGAPATASRGTGPAQAKTPRAPRPDESYPFESPPDDPLSSCTDMDSLAGEVRKCQMCGLRAGCSGVVFGEGNPAAKVLLVGEGPGAEEDRLLRPFVGAAGHLLDKILEACGFSRFEHVYIANVIKCRPPGNRTPEPEERQACWPNLRAQIGLIRPRIIVLLGATALQTLLDPNGRITRMRGHWAERNGLWFMPTYHPAALLRNPSLKKDCWEDFKQVWHKYRELIDSRHSSPHLP